MLSQSQIAKIQDLPIEGDLVSAIDPAVRASEGEVDAIVDRALKGVAASTEKSARIGWGPPGSGKDTVMGESDNALISYDEGPKDNGAIYALPGYEQALKDIAPDYQGQMTPVSKNSFKARSELWQSYQPLAQRVRYQIMKEALMRELPIDVSTTSSSPGNLKLIQLLRDLDYQSIEMVGAFAGFEVARERIYSRPRPGDEINDPVNKRIGALAMFDDYVREADLFTLYHNPENGKAPEPVAVFQEGEMIGVDSDGLNRVLETVADDRDKILQHLHDAGVLPHDLHRTMQKYDDAVTSFTQCVNAIRTDVAQILSLEQFRPSQG